MTVITEEFAGDPSLRFAAEGILHRVILTQEPNSRYAVLQIESIKGSHAYTATLDPEEREALARALMEPVAGHRMVPVGSMEDLADGFARRAALAREDGREDAARALELAEYDMRSRITNSPTPNKILED